jgi:hypothetical protein
MVNRISISNIQLYVRVVKVISTHMHNVEGNRFILLQHATVSQMDRWTNRLEGIRKAERERERMRQKMKD